MMKYNIAPDVVSCTALVDSLAAAGQWQLADKVCELNQVALSSACCFCEAFLKQLFGHALITNCVMDA